jgi:hypothetical protein
LVHGNTTEEQARILLDDLKQTTRKYYSNLQENPSFVLMRPLPLYKSETRTAFLVIPYKVGLDPWEKLYTSRHSKILLSRKMPGSFLPLHIQANFTP